MSKKEQLPICHLCDLRHHVADPPYCVKDRDRCMKTVEIRCLRKDIVRLRDLLTDALLQMELIDCSDLNQICTEIEEEITFTKENK